MIYTQYGDDFRLSSRPEPLKMRPHLGQRLNMMRTNHLDGPRLEGIINTQLDSLPLNSSFNLIMMVFSISMSLASHIY